MKGLFVIAAWAAMASAAMAGSNIIVVQQLGDTVTYRWGGRQITLPEIQQSFQKANNAKRAMDPNIQTPLDIVALGSTSMSALMPLFVCLKQAGQWYCTLKFSEKYNGEEWGLQVDVNLKQLLSKRKAGWLDEWLRSYEPQGDANSPNPRLSATGTPAR